MKFDDCKRCGYTIRWVKDDRHRMMAVDPTPTRNGNVRVTPGNIDDTGQYLEATGLDEARAAGEKLYVLHSRTCAGQGEFQ